MKRIYLLAFALLICSLPGMAQLSKVFDKYSDVDDVTSVYISKTMLRMMPDMKTDGMDIAGVASKIDQIRILTTENPTMAAKLQKDATNNFKPDGFEELMRVNEGKQKTGIYMKTGANGINEYVILNMEPTEFTLIQIEGSLKPTDVQQMVKK